MQTNLKIPGSYPAWENLKEEEEEEEEKQSYDCMTQEMLKIETGIGQVWI
jgi:hypothetical protein